MNQSAVKYLFAEVSAGSECLTGLTNLFIDEQRARVDLRNTILNGTEPGLEQLRHTLQEREQADLRKNSLRMSETKICAAVRLFKAKLGGEPPAQIQIGMDVGSNGTARLDSQQVSNGGDTCEESNIGNRLRDAEKSYEGLRSENARLSQIVQNPDVETCRLRESIRQQNSDNHDKGMELAKFLSTLKLYHAKLRADLHSTEDTARNADLLKTETADSLIADEAADHTEQAAYAPVMSAEQAAKENFVDLTVEQSDDDDTVCDEAAQSDQESDQELYFDRSWPSSQKRKLHETYIRNEQNKRANKRRMHDNKS